MVATTLLGCPSLAVMAWSRMKCPSPGTWIFATGITHVTLGSGLSSGTGSGAGAGSGADAGTGLGFRQAPPGGIINGSALFVTVGSAQITFLWVVGIQRPFM
jgi:hypothetical protein